MKTFQQIFNYLSWGTYLAVILLKTLGGLDIPWNVAIAPLVVSGVTGLIALIAILGNKEKIEKAFKEPKERHPRRINHL